MRKQYINESQLSKYIQLQYYMMMNIDNICCGAQCLPGAVWRQGTDSSVSGHPEIYASVKVLCVKWRNLHKKNEQCVHITQEQCQEQETLVPWPQVYLYFPSTFRWLKTMERNKRTGWNFSFISHHKKRNNSHRNCLCTASSQTLGLAAYKHPMS